MSPLHEPTSAKNLGKITRSPNHYYPGCDLILRAETTLYGVDMAKFSSRCRNVQEMLDSHRVRDARMGTNDDYPIVIEIAQGVMDTFMAALWQEGFLDKQTSEVPLVHILHMSYLFEVQDMRLTAIKKLHDHPDFNNPAERLHWSLEVNVEQWFEPAFTRLVSRPLSDLSLRQLIILGSVWLYELIQTRKKIETARAELAFSPPRHHNTRWCAQGTQGRRCVEGWVAFWEKTVAPMLVGNLPISNGSAAGLSTNNPPNICRRCFLACVAALQASDELDIENQVVRTEVERIRGEFFLGRVDDFI